MTCPSEPDSLVTFAMTVARTQPGLRHAIWWDTPPGRIVRAVCGVTVYRDEAVPRPTCAACQAALAQHDHLVMEER
jgi:hypothetical protein